MFNHFFILCKNIKSYDIYNAKESCVEKLWLAFFDKMKDKKRIKILLNVIERVYSKNPGIQTLIEESIIDICKDEEVSPKQVFFCLSLLFFFFIVMGYLNKTFLCAKESLLLVMIRKI